MNIHTSIVGGWGAYGFKKWGAECISLAVGSVIFSVGCKVQTSGCNMSALGVNTWFLNKE